MRKKTLFLTIFSFFFLFTYSFTQGTRPFDYFYYHADIPTYWGKGKLSSNHFLNSVVFKVENKDVRLLSFMGKNTYFTYPLYIILFPHKNLSKSDLGIFCKGSFINVLLNKSEIKDYKILWQPPKYRESLISNGIKIRYYGISGKGVHPTVKPLVLAVSLVQLSSKYGDVLIVVGLKVDLGRYHSRSKLNHIQSMFKTLIVDAIKVASASKISMPPSNVEMKRFLIKKGKFRYFLSSSSSNFSGYTNFSAISGKKLFFDFFQDGTCRVLDNIYSSSYLYGDLTPHLSSSSGSASEKWSKKIPFEVYGTYEKLWLVLKFPSIYKVYSLKKNGEIYTYVTVKTPSGWRNKKKRIRGLMINNNIEGYFTKFGVISIYHRVK